MMIARFGMGLVALILCFLVLINNVAEGSHKIYPELQSLSTQTTDDDVKQEHRTRFHFQPPRNWINDPNGPMYYKGFYHLFYQYNPKGAVWGNIVWAHSVSTDLVNWITLKPAIYPSKPFDKYGCWSGSATVVPGKGPVILYTGVVSPKPEYHQVQVYAIPKNASDPYLEEWVKPDDNPIAIAGSSNINATAFRDPTTAWRVGSHWRIIVGAKRNLKRRRGLAILYRSRDFLKWTKAQHPLRSTAQTGMLECPDFYPVPASGKKIGLSTSEIGDHVKHVLKYSFDLTRYEVYTVGKYDPTSDRYTPDNTSSEGWDGLRYDYGNFYASKTFVDEQKRRRVLWGWANESDSAEDDVAKGWAGIQAVPRTLWLDSSGKQLVQWPVVELEKLRGEKVELKDQKLSIGHNHEITGITAAQADVEVTFSFPSLDKAEVFDPKWVNAQDLCAQKGSDVQGGVGPFGLLTLASKNLEEFTPVFFRIFKTNDNKHKVLLCSDAKSSSLRDNLYKPSFAGFVDVDLVGRKLSLRSLIDHSVVESFGAGGRTCILSRVYPTLAVGSGAQLYAFNNGTETINVDHLTAWSMSPASLNQSKKV